MLSGKRSLFEIDPQIEQHAKGRRRRFSPGELWTRKWAEELSAIYELTGMPPHHCLQSYYRGTDRLYEADTFQKIIEEMEKHRRGAKKGTIVMDAGIATEANITWLKEHEYSYIVVHRGEAPFELDFHDMSVIEEEQKESSMMSRTEQLLLDRLNYYKTENR